MTDKILKYFMLMIVLVPISCCHAQKSIKKVPYWYVDSSNLETLLIRGKLMDSSIKESKTLIEVLNEGRNKYTPEIIYKKQIGDTLHISLAPEQMYSEQMGSTGAEHFLMQLVFTLTEDSSVQCIFLDIEIGSHGKPGYFKRENWESVRRLE